MALKTRKTTRSLKEALAKKPYEFEFVQAVHLLHLLSPEAIPLGTGEDFKKEAVDLKSHVFLSAPPSDVFRVTFPSPSPFSRWKGQLSPSKAVIPYVAPERPLLEDHREEEKPTEPVRLSVNFLGIAGIQGPLPLPYTEVLLNLLRQKDTVLRDFLDIFNHRFLSLYYRIEQKFSPSLVLSPPEKTVKGRALKSLAGWTTGGGKNLPFTPRHLLFYAGFFWQKPHNPYALKMILQTHFELPVEIISFQGTWMPLPASQRTHLGGARPGQKNRLGDNAVLGWRVWHEYAGLIVHVRLHDFQSFQRFLPFGDSFSVLKEFISFYLGPAFSFKIALSLDQKPPSRLGTSSFYLGWTSWLGPEASRPKTRPLPLHDQQVLLCPQRHVA